jgi:hypothetical protein
MTVLSDIIDAIHERLDDSSVERAEGRKSLSEHHRSRRICWIRVRSSVTAPANVGGKRAGNDRYRQIYTDSIAVEAHVQAESDDALEQLFANLLAASHAVCGTSAQPGAYQWFTEQEGQSGHVLRGPKLILAMTFAVPVTDEIRPLKQLTGQDHDITWQGGSGDEVVC